MSKISTVERAGHIHSIGYDLEDVEFEALRDFKVKVAGVEASARRGETSRIPYWVGRVLEINKLGTITLPDMVTALKQALSKERIGGQREFQTLEPLFYVKLKAAMRHLEGSDYDRVYNMLLELFRMRNTKIVTKASSMNLSAEMKKRLTVEEQAFYNTINSTCTDFQEHLTTIDGTIEDEPDAVKNADIIYESGAPAGDTGKKKGGDSS